MCGAPFSAKSAVALCNNATAAAQKKKRSVFYGGSSPCRSNKALFSTVPTGNAALCKHT